MANLGDIILQLGAQLDNPIERDLLESCIQWISPLIDAIGGAVAIPSYRQAPQKGAPYGLGPRAALDYVLELGNELGIGGQIIDDRVAYLKIGPEESHIAAVGHLDVVGADEPDWISDPFTLRIDQGRLFGRGVLDNKGPILTCLFAMQVIKEFSQEHGLSLDKGVRVIFGSNEETGMEDMAHYLAKEPLPVVGFTPDCKYPVVVGERGRLQIELLCSWDQAMAFIPFVNYYWISADPKGDRLGIANEHPLFGKLYMGNYDLSSNEEGLSFKFIASCPPVIQDQMVEKLKLMISEQGFGFRVINQRACVQYDAENPAVRVMANVYRDLTGEGDSIVTTTGGTYARVFPNIYPFGPSFPGQKGIAHLANEYWDLEDLVANFAIYTLTLWRLSQKKWKEDS